MRYGSIRVVTSVVGIIGSSEFVDGLFAARLAANFALGRAIGNGKLAASSAV